ncbi:Oidioi.mRNA.OKI2018_I69.XSR.g16346.t2.cds [Oikopleura dioica]|uniref:Oidioi.mRNA.OKI2018_I69.XSR.g16346.t2.cds n=1 Tax=Oikopleura dioica TaxID=34765 RepID=A0ABN7SFT0_OIKDI|nr:Oidioi.mRNA.OKI2018_I69.XSR.g16346.t2.cds [Oikopleura dioica]
MKILVGILSTLLGVADAKADTITFDKQQANNFFYKMLRPRKEGKLEVFQIPDGVVKDDSQTAYTNYLALKGKKAQSPQEALEYANTPGSEYALRKEDWVSINDDEFVFFPIPVSTRTYQVTPKTQQFLWIVGNEANWEPAMHRFRFKVDKMPQDALDSSALRVSFTVDDDDILQQSIRELFDTLVGYTSTDIEHWRVVHVDETAADGTVVVDFVYREGSECLSAYDDIWPFMTGSSMSMVGESEPKEDLRQAAATSGQSILTLSLTVPDACDVPMVAPPPRPKAPATQTQTYTAGEPFTVELLLGSGSAIDGVPSQFVAVNEDTASFLIPLNAAGKMTLKVSNGDTEYDLVLEPAAYEPFAGKSLTFDGGLSFEQRQQLVEKIPFPLVDSTQDGVAFGLPSSLCADLAEYDFISDRSAEVGGIVGTVDCQLKKKKLKKEVSLKVGKVNEIDLPSADMKIIDLGSLDDKLILVDDNVAKVLLPQNNLDDIAEDSLRIILADQENDEFEVVLDLSEAKENSVDPAFTLNFKFNSQPADRWGLSETLTALKEIKRAGVPSSFELIEVSDNVLVMTDADNANSKCSELEGEYAFIENGELYFRSKYFKDAWEISTIDSVSCKTPTEAPTTEKTTMKPTTSKPVCVLDQVKLQKKVSLNIQENVEERFSKEDLLENIEKEFLDQVEIIPNKVDASISNWNSFNEELTVFATWDAIVEMKSASGLEDKKASDISFTVSAENCKDQVIKFEFVVDFVDDCKKPSHVLSIELLTRDQKPMISDKYSTMEIIRETYGDDDMGFIRVQNFTKDSAGMIYITWLNHTEVICQEEYCPSDEVQHLVDFIVDQSNPQTAKAKDQFVNYFKGTDYILKHIKSLKINACRKMESTPKSDPVDAASTAGTSVILLIIGTIALVTAAIGCIYMKKKKENEQQNQPGRVQSIDETFTSRKDGNVTIMENDLNPAENQSLLQGQQDEFSQKPDSKPEGLTSS